MADPCVVFLMDRHNLNSVAALSAAIETCADLTTLPVRFVWWDRSVQREMLRLSRETAGPLWLVLSFMSPARARIHALVQALRSQPEIGNRLLVIAGGAHPTGAPLKVLQDGADIVVQGEGEWAFQQLLVRLQAGQSVDDIPGVCWLAEGQVRHGPQAHPIDLEQYLPFSLKYERFAPLEITRGCPFACHFCQTPFLHGGKVRHRSVQYLREFVSRAITHGYDFLRFVTPNAFGYGSPNGKTIDLAKVEELLVALGQLVPRERIYFGTFPSEVRPESVTKEALDLLRRHAANDSLLFGAQTGSPRLLAALHRGHTIEDVYRATRLTLDAGLQPIIDFIFGLPGEAAEDIRATMRVIKDLTAMGGIIHSHTFMPLPGTPFADAQPGKISRQYHPVLDRLSSQGKHFGQWRKQQAMSQRLND